MRANGKVLGAYDGRVLGIDTGIAASINPLSGGNDATMALNIDLKVLSANGYFDSVTPFSQTTTDLQNMPLTDPTVRQNLTIKYYPSGHMVYLDANSRTALKADLADFYGSTVSDRPAVQRIRARQLARRPERA